MTSESIDEDGLAGVESASVDKDGRGSSPRVLSVDVLRGLTILLMVFVNDLGEAAPSWLHHIEPGDADGMTLADIVFPFFLFIVGVSIPLAMDRSREAGKSVVRAIGHILTRTASLLLIGVIYEDGVHDRTLPENLWLTLAMIAVFMAWSIVPKEEDGTRKRWLGLKTIGIVGLVLLLAIYRREPESAEVPFWGTVVDWRWLKAGWWGILGLIGWAYLTVSLLMLWLGRRREWLMGALGCLILLHLAVRQDGLFSRMEDKGWLKPWFPTLRAIEQGVESVGEWIGLGDAVGSLAAITMAGCLLGSILTRRSDVTEPSDRLHWAFTFMIGLFIAGFLTDTFEGINKIDATPTWSLWCAGLACGAWMLLYLLVDVVGIRGWTILVQPAGANPLIAYFLHPILTGLADVSGLSHRLLTYRDSEIPWVVVTGSLVMAMAVCLGTGLLARSGLRIRL